VLKILRQGQRWIMAGVILLVGGAFVFFFGVGGSPFSTANPDQVIRVGDLSYDTRDFLRVRANQEEYYEGLLGKNFDRRTLQSQIDQMSAELLIQRAILSQEAKRLGLRVSDAELHDAVRAMAIFRDEHGAFQPQRLRSFVEYEYGREQNFVNAVRTDLLVQKMLRLLYSGIDASSVEAEEMLRYQREQVRIAYVALDPNTPPPGFAVTDAEAEIYAAAHSAQLQEIYDQRHEQYVQPEQVHARHILFKVAENASEKEVGAAQQRAAEVRERLLGGADFAALALELSEDTASKAAGGDLGFFRRGQMVPAFEDVAFTLKPGTLSEPVRSPFGFHVIRVEAKQDAKITSFEAARLAIARELMEKEAGQPYVENLITRLRTTLQSGKALEAAAREAGLTLERTALFSRNPEGQIPGLGAAPEVMHTAFALKEETGASPDRVLYVADKAVFIQLLEHRSPSDEEIAKEIPSERERLVTQKRQRVQEAWLKERRAELDRRGEIAVQLEAVDGS